MGPLQLWELVVLAFIAWMVVSVLLGVLVGKVLDRASRGEERYVVREYRCRRRRAGVL